MIAYFNDPHQATAEDLVTGVWIPAPMFVRARVSLISHKFLDRTLGRPMWPSVAIPGPPGHLPKASSPTAVHAQRCANRRQRLSLLERVRRKLAIR